MVTFAAGYIAGVFCAIVSHPADSVVSVINKNPGRTAGDSEYKFMSGTNIIKKFSLEGNGTKGCLEGSWCPYHHDRYIDCSPMVHLRWCQSRTQFATTTTTTDARITQKETPKLKYPNVLKLHVQNCVGMSQMWQPINKKRFTSSTSLF